MVLLVIMIAMILPLLLPVETQALWDHPELVLVMVAQFTIHRPTIAPACQAQGPWVPDQARPELMILSHTQAEPLIQQVLIHLTSRTAPTPQWIVIAPRRRITLTDAMRHSSAPEVQLVMVLQNFMTVLLMATPVMQLKAPTHLICPIEVKTLPHLLLRYRMLLIRLISHTLLRLQQQLQIPPQQRRDLIHQT